MVSIDRRSIGGEVFNRVRCLSTDTKPTRKIKNGSTLYEIDTGKGYVFDADSGTWIEKTSSGGIYIDASGVSF